jgi:Tol biopolymer transport system component
MTHAGTVAGTLSYMSPEQALGERIDHRTDLFSLGVVLYEMATGRRPFEGASEAALYDALLHGSPPAPSSLRARLPAGLDLVIGRALEKDRELRYQSAADLGADLKRLHRPSLSAERPALLARRPASHRPWQLATVLALAACGVLASLLWRRVEPAGGPDARFTLGPPPQADFTLSGTIVPAMTLTISPDGRRLVYLAGLRGEEPRLWVRPLASLDAVPLAGTEGATYPFWSPDSRSLAFFAGGALKRIDLDGGAPRTLAAGVEGRGGTWGADGEILIGSAEGPILRVAAAGGAVTPVTTLDRAQGEVWHRFPQLLPGGTRVLYLVRSGDGRRAVHVTTLDGRATTRLLETDVRASYSPSGHLLYMSEGVLMARPFDPERLQLSGEPAQVAAAVATSSAQDASFAISDTGVLVHATRTRAPGRLTWLDRAGRTQGVLGEVQDYLGLRRSPDGRTIAITRVDASTNAPDLWLLDVGRGVSSRFTFDPWIDVAPAWSPDGTAIVFASSRLGSFQFFRRPAAGGLEETVFFQEGPSKYPDDWSPDGRYIVYSTDPSRGYDLAMLRVADRQVLPLVATRFNEAQGRISPDGRWLAYTSDETGRPEVHVRGFPSGAVHVQLSSEGGSEPVWRGDGRELFYVAEDGRLVAVEVRSGGRTFEPGPPRVLFQTSAVRPRVPYVTRYAATADGQRFLFNVPVGAPAPPAITVTLDWRHAIR